MSRHMILLCNYGEVRLAWEAQNDDAIAPVIQNMLDQGYTFFTMAGETREQVSAVGQAVAARHIILPDEGLNDLIKAGFLTVSPAGDRAEFVTTGTAKTVEAVMANTTVASAPKRGG